MTSRTQSDQIVYCVRPTFVKLMYVVDVECQYSPYTWGQHTGNPLV